MSSVKERQRIHVDPGLAAPAAAAEERGRSDSALLRESEARFAAMFRLAADPMALVRVSDGVVLEANRSLAACFGYEPAEMIGRSTLPGDLGLWPDVTQRLQWVALLEQQGEALRFEAPLRRRDGSVSLFQLSGAVVRLGGERCVIWAPRDISRERDREEQLSRIAHYDALTGLPNRLLLADRLRQAIAQNQRAGTRVAVCYLDLDGFKDVNDTRGHQAGDQILVEVAYRLQAAVRAGDTVARLGGDEFALVLCGLGSDQECLKVLERVLATVAAPYRTADWQHGGISASVGVAIFPNDRDPDTLVRHADQAMYAAKVAGKNRYYFFDKPLAQRIEAKQATLKRIGSALAARQFVLHYQPKVDCRTGGVPGVEALIRWRHPVLGLLKPAEFLPVVEDDPMALSVGRWVVREAMRQMADWQKQQIDQHVSVNVFARQLLEPGFAPELREMLREYPHARADRLVLELSETVGLGHSAMLHRVIEECRALGVGFALDDFGSGHLSLAHLRNLPVQEIKIDQRIVRDLLVNADAEAMAAAVISLGRTFNRTVVAEGAETPAHVERLMQLGCEIIQGFALARPMDAADAARWVTRGRPEAPWHAQLAGPGL